MLSKGKLSQIKTAFKSVYGVRDIEEQELVRYGNEVIFYANNYPFEDDALTSLRFSTISDISESDAIMEYLAKIPEKEFTGSQRSTYGRLFEIGQKYGVGYLDKSKANKKEVTEVKEVVADIKSEANEGFDTNSASTNISKDEEIGYNTGMEISDDVNHGTKSAAPIIKVEENIETIETIKTKEETKMNAIDKLQQEANQTGLGANVDTNVTEVSKNDKLAAKKVVEATQVDRINYSQNAKISKVLITAIDREKKAVEGRASVGKVSKPKNALDTFISKTGCSVEEGVIKFSKLHSSELHDNAVKMYNLLSSAVANPETEVEPFFGKEGSSVPVSIKGIVINDVSNAESIIAQKDIAAHILQKAFLYLNVDSNSKAQFQLDAATSRGGQAPKKSYVVRVANKSDLIEDDSVCVYVKNIIQGKVSESKTGYKSSLSVSCNSNSLDPQGNPRKTTWRIPLEVEQFEVEIVDKYADLFKAGVGNTVKPMSANTEADILNIVGKITNMIAAEASKSSSDSIVGASMLAKVNDERGKIVAEDAASVNETLGTVANDEDFEG